MKGLLVVPIVILLVLAGPLVTIWALNTLFGLGIPFNFWTWLAVVWLCVVFNASSRKEK